jgi:hypothetical protein
MNISIVALVVRFAFLAHAATLAAAPAGLENTHVTPYMDATLERGCNTVFCSTFQIAWNDMKNGIIQENILLDEPLESVRILNRGLASKTDIGDEDYLAMVGFGADNIADEVNQALRQKFGIDAPQIDDTYNADDVILAYAFLTKELVFEDAFEGFEKPISFHGSDGDTPVGAFGVSRYSGDRHGNLQDQVEIIDYRGPGDFIVRLNSRHPDDEIILAAVEPAKTLLGTFETIDWRIARSRQLARVESLSNGDILQIPKFSISIDHSNSYLQGLHLLNSGFEEYFIQEARQDIRFTLDECGAAVTSEAILALKKGPPVDFKVLVFDRPFMLYIKKKDGAYPYLAIWVDNTNVLLEEPTTG